MKCARVDDTGFSVLTKEGPSFFIRSCNLDRGEEVQVLDSSEKSSGKPCTALKGLKVGVCDPTLRCFHISLLVSSGLAFRGTLIGSFYSYYYAHSKLSLLLASSVCFTCSMGENVYLCCLLFEDCRENVALLKEDCKGSSSSLLFVIDAPAKFCPKRPLLRRFGTILYLLRSFCRKFCGSVKESSSPRLGLCPGC